jgi:hypothetical protein
MMKHLTNRWSRPRAAVLSSFSSLQSFTSQRRALSLAAAHLVLVRPMSTDRALKLIIIRDVILFSAFTAYFCIPRQITVVVVGVVFVLTIRLFEKPLKGMAAKLDLRQKKIQFGVVCFFMLLWLGLLLAWIFRHSSAPAWAMGSLGIIVVLTLLYASYDMTFRRHPKV